MWDAVENLGASGIVGGGLFFPVVDLVQLEGPEAGRGPRHHGWVRSGTELVDFKVLLLAYWGGLSTKLEPKRGEEN